MGAFIFVGFFLLGFLGKWAYEKWKYKKNEDDLDMHNDDWR